MRKASEDLEELIMGVNADFNDSAGIAILYPCLLMKKIEELLPALQLTWEYEENEFDGSGFNIGYVHKKGFWSKTDIALIKLSPIPNSAAKCSIEINKETEYIGQLEEAIKKVNLELGLPVNVGCCLRPKHLGIYKLYEDGIKEENIVSK